MTATEIIDAFGPRIDTTTPQRDMVWITHGDDLVSLRVDMKRDPVTRKYTHLSTWTDDDGNPYSRIEDLVARLSAAA